MHPELHTYSRIKHAGTAATSATIVRSISINVNIDCWRSVGRCTIARTGDVTDQSRDWSQPDGSANADVETRAIPGGSRCQRSQCDVAHPSLADKRSEFLIVALAHVAVESKRVTIKESSARGGR